MREKMPKWLLIFNSISITNSRFFFTMLIAFGTAIHYWTTDIAPDTQWLFFLGALAGMDVAHYASKRVTHSGLWNKTNGGTNYGSATFNGNTETETTTTTDLQELSMQKG